MEKTPAGTSVGVEDPYAFVERCDHLTDDGRCRFAIERADRDPAFARERRAADFSCPVVDPEGDWEWADCPHFRCRNRARECARCGLGEVRLAHDDARPLLESHHLSYRDGATTADTGGADGAVGTGDADDAGSADSVGDGGRGTDDAGNTDAGEGDADEGVGSGDTDDASDDGTPSHEITVFLCRWCHAKVHRSWARVDDDASPAPEAIAAREARRSREREELGFASAAERHEEE
jgi:hypothetical protein